MRVSNQLYFTRICFSARLLPNSFIICILLLCGRKAFIYTVILLVGKPQGGPYSPFLWMETVLIYHVRSLLPFVLFCESRKKWFLLIAFLDSPERDHTFPFSGLKLSYARCSLNVLFRVLFIMKVSRGKSFAFPW